MTVSDIKPQVWGFFYTISQSLKPIHGFNMRDQDSFPLACPEERVMRELRGALKD